MLLQQLYESYSKEIMGHGKKLKMSKNRKKYKVSRNGKKTNVSINRKKRKVSGNMYVIEV